MAVEFNVGDRVTHRLFGNGTVIDILPIRDDIILTIDFDNGKTRKLCAYVAKLEKIQTDKDNES